MLLQNFRDSHLLRRHALSSCSDLPYQAPPPMESVPEAINPRINAEAGMTTSVVSVNGQTFVEHRGVQSVRESLNKSTDHAVRR